MKVTKFNENLVDSMKYLSIKLFNQKLWATEFTEYADHTRVNATFHDYITLIARTNALGPIEFLFTIFFLYLHKFYLQIKIFRFEVVQSRNKRKP